MCNEPNFVRIMTDSFGVLMIVWDKQPFKSERRDQQRLRNFNRSPSWLKQSRSTGFSLHPYSCFPRSIKIPCSLFNAKSQGCWSLFAMELLRIFLFKFIEPQIKFLTVSDNCGIHRSRRFLVVHSPTEKKPFGNSQRGWIDRKHWRNEPFHPTSALVCWGEKEVLRGEGRWGGFGGSPHYGDTTSNRFFLKKNNANHLPERTVIKTVNTFPFVLRMYKNTKNVNKEYHCHESFSERRDKKKRKQGTRSDHQHKRKRVKKMRTR